MSKREILEQTVQKLERLPIDQLTEVADFTDFLLQKSEERMISKSVTILNAESSAFDFLQNEEDIYSVDDLKERYR